MEKNNNDTEKNITFTARQLSFALAAIVAIACFIFIAGYYLGKKRAAQEFSYTVDQDSLADQIYSSLCGLYEVKDNEISPEQEEADEESAPLSSEISENSSPQENSNGPIGGAAQYRAIIAGFSSSNVVAGKDLVARLTNSGYPCELVERFSRAKGKTVVWYQVATKPYESSLSLEKVKPKIAKLAHVSPASIHIEPCA